MNLNRGEEPDDPTGSPSKLEELRMEIANLTLERDMYRSERDAARKALKRIRQHHVRLNARACRPIEESKTIALCDSVLKETE